MSSKESKKKKKKKEGISTPPMGAGLLIFYEEETPGVKVGPTFVFLLTFGLIFAVLILWFLAPPS
ncbi:MAG: preprotein translocase subunit Sec61beta [Candidatus Njordarchaeota archaeon]